MDDGIGLEPREEVKHALTVADVELVVVEIFDQLGEALLVPTRVALRTEENGALVVVEAVDFPAEVGEMETDFRADEAGGTGDEEFFHESSELGVLNSFQGSVFRIKQERYSAATCLIMGSKSLRRRCQVSILPRRVRWNSASGEVSSTTARKPSR